MSEKLSALTTEQINQNTSNIDKVSTLEMLQMMNNEDANVITAVRDELPNIARAVDAIAGAFSQGGRLLYFGAGTSGRLGVLDASECPPTFGVSQEMVTAVMAGGSDAMFVAKEGAEDDRELGRRDANENKVSAADVVVGIAASGRTPYVLGALEAAREAGAVTVGLSNSAGSLVSRSCDIAITPIVGPEALTGSTRLKSGTSQKLVLNMLTTGAMIKIGKTYGNLMVDVKPTNEKLVDRAARIVVTATGADYAKAGETLRQAGNNPKLAIVMLKTNKTREQAEELLRASGGFVSKAVNED